MKSTCRYFSIALTAAVLLAPLAQAYDAQYECYPSKKNRYLEKSLVLETVDNDRRIWVDGNALRQDPTYRPRTYKNRKRYIGNTKFLDVGAIRDSKIEVLLSADITPVKRFLTVRILNEVELQSELFACIDVQAGT